MAYDPNAAARLNDQALDMLWQVSTGEAAAEAANKYPGAAHYLKSGASPNYAPGALTVKVGDPQIRRRRTSVFIGEPEIQRDTKATIGDPEIQRGTTATIGEPDIRRGTSVSIGDPTIDRGDSVTLGDPEIQR
jgi:hypothetical protein